LGEAKLHKYSGLGSGGTAFLLSSRGPPRIIGLSMQVLCAGDFDSCIVFDGDPVKHIGTAGVVESFWSATMVEYQFKVYWNFDFPNDCNNQEITKSRIAFWLLYFSSINRGHDGVITSGSPT